MAACDPSGGDVHAAMTGLGYEPWCQVGYDVMTAPVVMAIFSREAPPLQFLLQLEGNAGNIVEHVFAETLPDAMDLLAKWSPAARTAEPPGRLGGFGEHAPPRVAEADAPAAMPWAEPPRNDPASV